MLRLLGWDLDGPLEVQAEYPVIRDRMDYALVIDDKPSLLVEAKRAGSNLSDLASIAQAVNYGNALNVPWAVLTNGPEWSLCGVSALFRGSQRVIGLDNAVYVGLSVGA